MAVADWPKYADTEFRNRDMIDETVLATEQDLNAVLHECVRKAKAQREGDDVDGEVAVEGGNKDDESEIPAADVLVLPPSKLPKYVRQHRYKGASVVPATFWLELFAWYTKEVLQWSSAVEESVEKGDRDGKTANDKKGADVDDKGKKKKKTAKVVGFDVKLRDVQFRKPFNVAEEGLGSTGSADDKKKNIVVISSKISDTETRVEVVDSVPVEG